MLVAEGRRREGGSAVPTLLLGEVPKSVEESGRKYLKKPTRLCCSLPRQACASEPSRRRRAGSAEGEGEPVRDNEGKEPRDKPGTWCSGSSKSSPMECPSSLSSELKLSSWLEPCDAHNSQHSHRHSRERERMFRALVLFRVSLQSLLLLRTATEQPWFEDASDCELPTTEQCFRTHPSRIK